MSLSAKRRADEEAKRVAKLARDGMTERAIAALLKVKKSEARSRITRGERLLSAEAPRNVGAPPP